MNVIDTAITVVDSHGSSSKFSFSENYNMKQHLLKQILNTEM